MGIKPHATTILNVCDHQEPPHLLYAVQRHYLKKKILRSFQSTHTADGHAGEEAARNQLPALLAENTNYHHSVPARYKLEAMCESGIITRKNDVPSGLDGSVGVSPDFVPTVQSTVQGIGMSTVTTAKCLGEVKTVCTTNTLGIAHTKRSLLRNGGSEDAVMDVDNTAKVFALSVVADAQTESEKVHRNLLWRVLGKHVHQLLHGCACLGIGDCVYVVHDKKEIVFAVFIHFQAALVRAYWVVSHAFVQQYLPYFNKNTTEQQKHDWFESVQKDILTAVTEGAAPEILEGGVLKERNKQEVLADMYGYARSFETVLFMIALGRKCVDACARARAAQRQPYRVRHRTARAYSHSKIGVDQFSQMLSTLLQSRSLTVGARFPVRLLAAVIHNTVHAWKHVQALQARARALGVTRKNSMLTLSTVREKLADQLAGGSNCAEYYRYRKNNCDSFKLAIVRLAHMPNMFGQVTEPAAWTSGLQVSRDQDANPVSRGGRK